MKNKYNSKQRMSSIQGLRSFKDTLPKNIRKIIGKRGNIFSETLDNWKYIVDEEIFKICYPKSFRSSNKFSSSYLTIMVKRGHEVELEYSKKKILDKMNIFFGYKVVDRIKFLSFEGEENLFDKNKKNLKKQNLSSNTKKERIDKLIKLNNWIDKK